MILETFARIFVDADALDRTVEFYQARLGGEETMCFAYPEVGLTLASVASPRLSVPVIAGEPEKRRPFEATRLTIKVSALEEFLTTLRDKGADQPEPVQQTLVRRKTRFRRPDGLEYVDHDAS